MGRPKAKGAPSEMDELLDKIAPDVPEPKEELEEELEAAPEAKTEPESKADQQISYSDAEFIKSQEQPAEPVEQLADDADDPEDDEPAPQEPEPSPSPEPQATVEQLEAMNKGLQNEVRKLREKAVARASQAVMAQPAPDASAAQPYPAHVPPEGHQQPGVEFDDMIVFADGKAGIDPTKFEAAVRRATAPDPRAVAQQENQRFHADFLASAETPEARAAHTHALTRTEQAYEHLQLSMQERAAQYGMTLEGARYDEVVGFLRQSGVLDEIGQVYPDVAPDFPAMLAASAMHSHEMMANALKGYVARNSQPLAPTPAPSVQVPVQSAPAATRPLPVTRAPSLGDVGTVSAEPTVSDKARFEQLDKEFAKNPMGFPAKKLAELERLEERFA